MTEELLKKYIYYFGDKPPFPPKHIMESLVRMKDDGTFGTKFSKTFNFVSMVSLMLRFSWYLPFQKKVFPPLISSTPVKSIFLLVINSISVSNTHLTLHTTPYV